MRGDEILFTTCYFVVRGRKKVELKVEFFFFLEFFNVMYEERAMAPVSPRWASKYDETIRTSSRYELGFGVAKQKFISSVPSPCARFLSY